MADRRWGFMVDGVFIPVPKTPIKEAGLHPPCTVQTYFGNREIIEEPELKDEEIKP